MRGLVISLRINEGRNDNHYFRNDGGHLSSSLLIPLFD